jgi:hypothetical protein
MSTVPITPAGLVAVQLVLLTHVTPDAGAVPTTTAVAPGVVPKPVPVIVIIDPPAVDPELGEMPVTASGGGGATYVNRSTADTALDWEATVTRTSTVPAAPAGLDAVQLVVLAQVTPVPATVPKTTAVAPGAVANPVPVTVTAVPPAVGPELGEMAVTAGGAGGGLAATQASAATTSRRPRP